MARMLDDSELWELFDGDKYQPSEDLIASFRDESSIDVPVQLTDMKIWNNYVDPTIYELDKHIRKFFKRIQYHKKKKGSYDITASQMFKFLFGRAAEPKDSYMCRLINTIMEYYCTTRIRSTTYLGKKVSNLYTFSRYSVVNKRPYSIKLRLEEAKNGQDPWRRAPSKDKRPNGRRSRRDLSAS